MSMPNSRKISNGEGVKRVDISPLWTITVQIVKTARTDPNAIRIVGDGRKVTIPHPRVS